MLIKLLELVTKIIQQAKRGQNSQQKHTFIDDCLQDNLNVLQQ